MVRGDKPTVPESWQPPPGVRTTIGPVIDLPGCSLLSGRVISRGRAVALTADTDEPLLKLVADADGAIEPTRKARNQLTVLGRSLTTTYEAGGPGYFEVWQFGKQPLDIGEAPGVEVKTLSPGKRQLFVQISSIASADRSAQLQRIAKHFEILLDRLADPDVREVSSFPEPGPPSMNLRIDQKRARALGIHDSDVARAIRTSQVGVDLRSGLGGQRVVLRTGEAVSDQKALLRFKIKTRGSNPGQAGLISVGQVAQFEMSGGALPIFRIDRRPVVVLRVLLSSPSASAKIVKVIKAEQKNLEPTIRLKVWQP